MGGRLSPILANIYMEHLEYRVICSSLIVPKLFFRYVDDIFIVWNEELGPYSEFLALLNGFHPDINLTEEREVNGVLPLLDLLVKRPSVSEKHGIEEKLQLSIFRKPTHCDRYVPFNSAHHMDLKRNMVRGQLLRAFRLLHNFPRQLQSELDHLKRVLANNNNGYPEHILRKWFGDFHKQIRQRPEKLEVKSRLKFEDLFDENSQQRFVYPTAIMFYKDRLGNESMVAGNENGTGNGSGTALDLEFSQKNGASDSLSQVANLKETTQDLLAGSDGNGSEMVQMALVDNNLRELDDATMDQESREQDLMTATQEMDRIIDTNAILSDATNANNDLPSTGTNLTEPTQPESILIPAGEEQIPSRRPTMILPFIPGTSDKLRRIGTLHGLATWFSYPGRLSDLFTQYRGRLHYSKSRDSIYCLPCSCGVEYIGESGRNLKVRVAEHLRNSSKSALSLHLLNNDTHRPNLKQIQIIARECITSKRKIIETLAIEHKKAKLCNSGSSIELPLIWQLCAPKITKQLSKFD